MLGVVIGPKCCLKQDTSEFAIDFKAEIVYCRLIVNESLCSELRNIVLCIRKLSEGLVMNCYQLGGGIILYFVGSIKT